MMQIGKKDFLYFKSRCVFWIKKFGLQDIIFEFKHNKLDGNMAQFWYSYTGRKATITLKAFRSTKQQSCPTFLSSLILLLQVREETLPLM